MGSKYLNPIIAGVLAGLAFSSGAQQQDDENVQSVSTGVVETVEQSSHLRSTEASFWGLNEEDWKRYSEIMEGPQGRWTPAEDPTFVLGQWARTPAELRRYAELQVEVEKKRAERAIAFELAYQDAWRRLYPDLSVVDEQKLAAIRNKQDIFNSPSGSNAGLPWEEGLQPGDRLILFISPDCRGCEDIYQNALMAVRSSAGIGLDLFFDKFSNEQIQKWAFDHQVPLAEFQQKRITLNGNGADLKSQLKAAHGGQVGLFYRRRGNQYGEVQL